MVLHDGRHIGTLGNKEFAVTILSRMIAGWTRGFSFIVTSSVT
jgi:hypothetical protein